MGGSHRIEGPSKARTAVAGALTAGALLLAPVGAAVAGGGIANAAPPTHGGGDPGGPDSGGGTGGSTGATTYKRIIHLPGLKIEIKNTVGDHLPPKIKFVPFPGLHLPGA